MICTEIILEQGSPEWLSFRKQKIGSSDASTIMEASKWKTPYQLWGEKLDLLPSPNVNDAMRRGISLEPIARQKFEDITGIIVCPKVFIHNNIFMIASLDGVDIDNQIAVEIKCPGRTDHEMAMDGIIPSHYYPQLQHQMYVLGIPMIYYFSYNQESYNLIEVEFDKDYCKKLVDAEFKFWNNLQTLEPPALIERDYINKTDADWCSKANRWKEINTEIRALELEEKELRKQLIQMTDNQNVRGGGIKVSSSLRKGTIDYSAIPNLKEVDLEKYRKPKSVVWRLSEI